MHKLNEKHYELFSVDERLNLTIAAFARNDESEINLLFRTCPKKAYYFNDYAFEGRYTAIEKICSNLVEILHHLNGKANMFNYAIKAFKISSLLFDDLATLPARYNFISKEVNNSLQFIELQIERLNSIRKEYIARIKSVYKALSEFCCHIDIDANNLLDWINTKEIDTNINNLSDDGIEDSREFTSFLKDAFLSTWRSYL